MEEGDDIVAKLLAKDPLEDMGNTILLLDNVAGAWNTVLVDWKNGKIDHKQAVLRCINLVTTFLLVNHRDHNGPRFNLVDFAAATEKGNLGSERRVRDRDLVFGCMFYGLKRFGATPGQARSFMLAAFKCTATACTAAEKIFKFEASGVDELNNEQFLLNYFQWILELPRQKIPQHLATDQKLIIAFFVYSNLIEDCLNAKMVSFEADQVVKYRPFSGSQTESEL